MIGCTSRSLAAFDDSLLKGILLFPGPLFLFASGVSLVFTLSVLHDGSILTFKLELLLPLLLTLLLLQIGLFFNSNICDANTADEGRFKTYRLYTFFLYSTATS